MQKLLLAAAATALLTSGALAQNGTTTGAAGGAVTGAIVGGPVGAAVGAVGGAVVGTALDPPPAEVRTYVMEQPVEPVVIEQPIAVGQPLPETVVLHPVPEHTTYTYAYVNDQRVIVDPGTRHVVAIVN